MDDTVKYYDPVHQIFIYTVAVPALFLYGFVFIVLALLYIGLHQDRQTNKKLIFRFGLLFSLKKVVAWMIVLVQQQNIGKQTTIIARVVRLGNILKPTVVFVSTVRWAKTILVWVQLMQLHPKIK